MTNLPTLRQMLEAGVHFGHKKARWNPKMADYIFTTKNGVHVINLEKTQEKIIEANDYLAKLASQNKKIVFVGTKKQAGEIVKKAAEECGMPYITARWLGGMLTNYSQVKKAFKKLEKAKSLLESDNKEMTKREKTKLKQEVEKRDKLVGGLIGLTEKPDALILIGANDEKIALREANQCGFPTVALVDTNCDPTQVTYPIPANDDATKSIELFANLFSKIISDNKNKKPAEDEK